VAAPAAVGMNDVKHLPVHQGMVAAEINDISLGGTDIMKKTTTRFWVDVVMFVSLFGLLITGLIMAFFTNSGPNVTEASKYFLKLHRHQWGGIHSYFAIVFTLMLFIHLILEWKWIIGKTRNLFRKSWMLAPIVMAAVLIVFISWALAPKDFVLKKKSEQRWKQQRAFETGAGPGDSITELQPAEKGLKNGDKEEPCDDIEIKHESLEVVITGQDSLQSIERKTGIPAGDIIKKAGLPEDISLIERLGRLKRIYNFSIQDIREAIRKLQQDS
jgi:hypothetical protein